MVCPIAGYKIDENGARVVAGFVLVSTLVALVVPSSTARWIFLFLAHDFGFRAFSRPRWSVMGRLSSAILAKIGIAPRPVDAGAKRFAARVGLVFSVSLLVLTYFDLPLATQVVAGALAFCAALESLLGFCVGCQMWTLWYAWRDRISGGRADGREV